MPKILIIGINFAPELIGVGKYTGELAEFLDRSGDQVKVITAPPHYPNWVVRAPYRSWQYRKEKIGGVSVTRCPLWARNRGRGIWRILAPLSFAVSSFFSILKQLLFSRPDIVLCVEPSFMSAIATAVLARLLRIRRVLHVQDLEIDAAFAVGYVSNSTFKRLALGLEKYILKQFDQIITISDKMRDKLIEKELDEGKIKIVRNWIEPDLLDDADGHTAREKIKIAKDKFIVLYSGHIGKKQDLTTVLQSAEVLAQHTDIQFVIAGDGPEKDDLQFRFRHLTNIVWLPLQPIKDFRDLLMAADCHLMPQHGSAADLVLPSKLGAILATGAPLIVTAQSDTELALFLENSAYLISPGQHDKMADAILVSTQDQRDLKAARLSLAQKLCATHILPKFREHLLTSQ